MVSPLAVKSKRPTRLGIDVYLLVALIALMLFGILMLYSASADISFRGYADSTYIVRRQLIFLGLGIILALGLTWINYHLAEKIAVPAMIITIALLFGVIIFGDVNLGATRSLFKGSVQPSELAKLMIVIYLAVWLFKKRDQLRYITFGLLPMSVILGIIGSLIFAQPDYSALVTIIILGILMFFLAGGDLRHVGIVLLGSSVVGYIVLKSGFISTGSSRIDSFFEGLRNPLNYSDHVRRSLEAFIRGGWFGVGIGKSETKLLSLPVPHTDSIFAVVGEETGLFGAVILIILYLVVVWRGLLIARRAPDELGMLLAGGLSFWIGWEAFINMAVMVGLMPVAGNALPFISYGGSSLVTIMIAIGIIFNISRQSEHLQDKEEKAFNAVVNLRRGDRRRRVSRPRRTSGVGDDAT
jgi:cell division protein FtsW